MNTAVKYFIVETTSIAVDINFFLKSRIVPVLLFGFYRNEYFYFAQCNFISIFIRPYFIQFEKVFSTFIKFETNKPPPYYTFLIIEVVTV